MNLVPIIVAGALLLPGASATRSEEAAVALCRHPVAAARRAAELPQADGSTLHLLVAPVAGMRASDGCAAAPLGVPVDAVAWLGGLAARELDATARIAVTTRGAAGRIVAIAADRPAPARAALLLPRAELLPFASHRAFGVEGRAAAAPGLSSFDISCTAGRRPAGVAFDLGAADPHARLAIDLLATASPGFRAEVVPRGTDAVAGTPIAPKGTTTVSVPNAAEATLVIACPTSGGTLRVERGTVRAAAGTRQLPRPGAWVWEPGAWRRHPAELIRIARRLDIGRLYITIGIEAGRVTEPEPLARFLAAAHAAGIAVAAVEGDPAMTDGDGRVRALARAAALAAFNRTAPRTARLDGVQYDIEPYLEPAFSARSALSWQRWADTLLLLSAALGTPVEAVVPWWMLESRGAAGALDRARPALGAITVMAYRTDPAEIVAAAAPLLGWAAERRVPAAIALEASALAREYRRVYVPSVNGELHVIRFDDVAAVVMLDRMRAGAARRAYRLSHIVPADPARVSFNGDSAAMFRAAAAIAPDILAWPSAARLVFHGLPEVTPTAIAARGGGGAFQP